MSERPGTQPSMDMKNVAVGPIYVPELHWQILWRSPPYIREPILGDGWRRGRVQWGPLARGR